MHTNNRKYFEDGLLGIIAFGKGLVEEYETINKDLQLQIIVSLLHIESVLDSSRTLLIDSTPETRDSVTRGMDEIRAGIVACMEKGDKQEIQMALRNAGEQFKSNFISVLK